MQGALASHVLPSLLVMLFGHSRLNFPVKKEGVQALDWRVAFLG